jgi:hypothetical protein
VLKGPQPYQEFYIRVGDEDIYGIDWTRWLQNQWQGGVQVVANAVVRPSKANGYEYLCSTGGQTAEVEPSWPVAPGSTVTDGSVVWTCQVASTASLTTTVQSVSWMPPAGIVVSSPALTGQVASALINATGATANQDYPVKCIATFADGENKTGILNFKVR